MSLFPSKHPTFAPYYLAMPGYTFSWMLVFLTVRDSRKPHGILLETCRTGFPDYNHLYLAYSLKRFQQTDLK